VETLLYRLFAAALLLPLALGAAATAQAGERSFAVLTYNVRGLPAVIAGSRTPQIEDVARSLGRFRTSIAPLETRTLVALQEVFVRSYHDVLAKKSGYEFTTKQHDGSWTGLGDGLAILSDLRIAEYSRTQWKKCHGTLGRARNDCHADKGYSFVRIELDYGLSVDVYVLHADAGGDSGSRDARRKNIEQLVDAIRTNSPLGRAVLVLGDTNGRYTRGNENLPDLLTGAGLTDVWVQLRRSGKVPPAGEPIRTNCRIDPASSDCELKDKVLYRSGDQVILTPRSYETPKEMFSDERGNSLSDHYPVAVRFAYAGTNVLPDAGRARVVPPSSEAGQGAQIADATLSTTTAP
jgi:endonuclease/exonuclease/phosphatase family metal-dependent hydrolase